MDPRWSFCFTGHTEHIKKNHKLIKSENKIVFFLILFIVLIAIRFESEKFHLICVLCDTLINWFETIKYFVSFQWEKSIKRSALNIWNHNHFIQMIMIKSQSNCHNVHAQCLSCPNIVMEWFDFIFLSIQNDVFPSIFIRIIIVDYDSTFSLKHIDSHLKFNDIQYFVLLLKFSRYEVTVTQRAQSEKKKLKEKRKSNEYLMINPWTHVYTHREN